jgi:RNA-dependent RNA polymerase
MVSGKLAGELRLRDDDIHAPTCLITPRMLVTKNPCLHPGDIRVLRGTYKQELAHLVNVVVFPQRVTRWANVASL